MLGIIASATQGPISDDRISSMLQWRPRRMQLAHEWKALHPPEAPGRDWALTLPFCETLRNALEIMCDVETIGLRNTNNRCWTYLRDTDGDAEPPPPVSVWLRTVGQYVAIRDCLALSFALDYDKQFGNPDNPQTTIGRLRARAKPYDKPVTRAHLAAAEELVEHLANFTKEIWPYGEADAIVAVPPSDPAKTFDLTTHLAALLGEIIQVPVLTTHVRTVRSRPSIKSTPLDQKLAKLAHSIEGRRVLVVDDLYQSGVSINYVGKLLIEARAAAVFGLAC